MNPHITGRRILAIFFVFACAAVAWFTLGASLVHRSGTTDGQLSSEITRLWGGSHQQQAPQAWWIERKVVTGSVLTKNADGQEVARTVRNEVETSHPLPLLSSLVTVDLDLEHRRKGLLWYDVYTVAFDGRYRVRVPEGAHKVKLHFAFPTAEAMYDGLVLSVSTLVTATLCTGLILLYVRYGSRSTIKQYLGLKPVAWKTVGIWFAVTALFLLLSDGLTYLLDRPVTPDFLVRTYATAGFLPLFLLALVVLGPLFEEVLFRGFMFAGLRHSRLGNPGAIVVTAVLWAAIHLQYDIYGIATIFAMGILLGVVRMKTGSLYLTFALHATVNLLAVTQVVLLD